MIKINNIINDEINIFITENNYVGQHSAPHIDSDDAPMHDLIGIYDDDIYGQNAARIYQHYGDYRDYGAINIIQSARNNPNKSIKIYRAVPDINFDNKVKLKPLIEIINYYNKFKFFPMKNEIIYGLQDKYSIDNHSYDDQKKMILDDINQQIINLESQQKKQYGINNNDWVTIDRNYAKEHGNSNLNKFKIVSKTVRARQLFTDGNDIFEWGYSI